nr:hypothetical protein [Tanacetum cinerariifolium]
ATLVTQGYTQEEGIDYDEMDVKSAFLYGIIEEELFVCQPPGFKDPYFPNKVYNVEKALYGLHQAPRACLDLLRLESPSWVLFERENKKASSSDNPYDWMILVNPGYGIRTDNCGNF